MISSKDFDCAGFNMDLRGNGLEDKLNDIDTLLDVADRGNHWTSGFYSRAMQQAKKVFLRKLLREGYEDADGKHVEFFRVQETDPETGEITNGYKQLEFFTVGNFEWTIRDRLRRIHSERAIVTRLLRLLGQTHGAKALVEVQSRLGFTDPVNSN